MAVIGIVVFCGAIVGAAAWLLNRPERPKDPEEDREQAHWCRGGTFYPVSYCEHFIKYQGSEIEDCVRAPVQYFQDGYLKCTLKDRIGCEACTMGKNDKNIFDCQYMTDSGCNKLIEAKNRMLDAIASGAETEPCERQCCAGCTRQCQYRCGVK